MARLGSRGRRRIEDSESRVGPRYVVLMDILRFRAKLYQLILGLTTWDTANVYSSGVNEEIIGKAIKKFEIPRHKVTILAKCYGTVPDEPKVFNWFFEAQMQQTKDYVNQGGRWLCQNHIQAVSGLRIVQVCHEAPFSKQLMHPSNVLEQITLTCFKSIDTIPQFLLRRP